MLPSNPLCDPVLQPKGRDGSREEATGLKELERSMHSTHKLRANCQAGEGILLPRDQSRDCKFTTANTKSRRPAICAPGSSATRRLSSDAEPCTRLTSLSPPERGPSCLDHKIAKALQDKVPRRKPQSGPNSWTRLRPPSDPVQGAPASGDSLLSLPCQSTLLEAPSTPSILYLSIPLTMLWPCAPAGLAAASTHATNATTPPAPLLCCPQRPAYTLR